MINRLVRKHLETTVLQTKTHYRLMSGLNIQCLPNVPVPKVESSLLSLHSNETEM